MGITLIDRIEEEFARADEIRAQHERLTRGRELADGIVILPDGAIAVEGTTGAYEIRGGVCSCPDARYRRRVHGGLCKHRFAAEVALARAGLKEQRDDRSKDRTPTHDRRGRHPQAHRRRRLSSGVDVVGPEGGRATAPAGNPGPNRTAAALHLRRGGVCPGACSRGLGSSVARRARRIRRGGGHAKPRPSLCRHAQPRSGAA